MIVELFPKFISIHWNPLKGIHNRILINIKDCFSSEIKCAEFNIHFKESYTAKTISPSK
jgi:hypothetical protein